MNSKFDIFEYKFVPREKRTMDEFLAIPVTRERLLAFLENNPKADLYLLMHAIHKLQSVEYMKVVLHFMNIQDKTDSVFVLNMLWCLREAIIAQAMDVIDFLIDECSVPVKFDDIQNVVDEELAFIFFEMPLYHAIKTGNIDIVRRILDAGAEVQSPAFNSLRECIEYYGMESPIWTLLMAYGADINYITDVQAPIILFADEREIAPLINLGFDIHILDKNGKGLLELIMDGINSIGDLGSFVRSEYHIDNYIELAEILISRGCSIPDDTIYKFFKDYFKLCLDKNIDDILSQV